MTSANRSAGTVWAAWLVCLGVVLGIAGCGTPSAPQPPSLNLPGPVGDLSAVRTGNQVALTWTMPKRNTDKLPLKNDVAVHICRREGAADCVAVADLSFAPAASASYKETLPGVLIQGAPRAVTYFVELKNRHGRSAGLSNAAPVLAGEAPAPVVNLAADVRKSGVVLQWTRGDSSETIRLDRKLLTPERQNSASGPLAPPPQPVEKRLLVKPDAGRALDKDITLGNTYEYTAQRVAQITIEGKTLELGSAVSAPLRVEAHNIFPPAVPAGLAAVATAPSAGTEASIDLNWQPDTESDLVGYFVYRREGEGPWRRISSAQPQAVPAFHDAQVQPGHTYRYAVSAVDQGGHESARSTPAEEIVPNP